MGESNDFMAAVGDNCIDVYIDPVGLTAVGGNALNVAVRWARSGRETVYFGAVGNDPAGTRIHEMLTSEGVATRIAVIDGSTAVTTVGLTATRERELLTEDFGVGETYRPNQRDLELLRGARWVHCTLSSGPASIRSALPSTVPVSCDMSTRHADYPPNGVDLAFLSDSGGSQRDAAELARATVARGAKCAVVTRGAGGSVAFDGEQTLAVDALLISPVDTLGAGDAYIAALVGKLIDGGPLRDAMQAGAAAASEACMHLAGFEQQLEPLDPALLSL